MRLIDLTAKILEHNNAKTTQFFNCSL